MRCQAAFLVAVVLPTAVILQNLSTSTNVTETLTPAALLWIGAVLDNITITSTTTAATPDIGSRSQPDLSPSVSITETLTPAALLWIGAVLDNITTTSTTTAATPDIGSRSQPDLSPSVSDTENAPCTTSEGVKGLCVLESQCDVQAGIELRDSTCGSHICCALSAINVTTPGPEISMTTSKPVTNTDCGWSNPSTNVLRIKDNDYAEFGEYPWMIAVLQKSVGASQWSQQQYVGGGTLIHPSVVITVAHKVYTYKPDQIKCRAGEWNIHMTYEPYPHQERDVKKIITHENYTMPAYNDILMMVLSTPFALENAPQIGVACLSNQLPAPGTKCYSMGWGQELKGDKYVGVLKKVELPFVPLDECETQLRKSRLGDRFRMHVSQLCAGGVAGADTCKGDGGSPLVCSIEDGPFTSRYSVYGMVAFGAGCGMPIPGGYASIPHLHSWVDSKMTAEGFGTSSYRP